MNTNIAQLIANPGTPIDPSDLTPDRVQNLIKEIVTSGPAFVTDINRSIAELVATPCLHFENGVFQLTGPVETEVATKITAAVAKLMKCSDAATNMSRWILGNIAVLFDEAGLSMEEFMGEHDINYNTLVTSRTTFTFFRNRRFRLPFAHHKELAYAADLSDEQKMEIGAVAEENNLPLTRMRLLIRAMQKDIRMKNKVLPAQSYHDTVEPQAPRTKQYLIISGSGRKVVDGRPDEGQVDRAEAVYEIKSVLKDAKPES